jgi:hypothetical protein
VVQEGSTSRPHTHTHTHTNPRTHTQALTPELLKSVTAKYDVEYAAHLKIMSDMYTQYLLAMLDWHEVRMGEPQVRLLTYPLTYLYT